jgi:hypothetical protein
MSSHKQDQSKYSTCNREVHYRIIILLSPKGLVVEGGLRKAGATAQENQVKF